MLLFFLFEGREIFIATVVIMVFLKWKGVGVYEKKKALLARYKLQ